MKKYFLVFCILIGINSLLSAQDEEKTTHKRPTLKKPPAGESSQQDDRKTTNAFRMAESAFGDEDYARAIDYYSKVIELNPNSSNENILEAYFKRGLSKNLSKQFEGAVPDFTKCIENNYKTDEPKKNRQLALDEQKKSDQAEYGSLGKNTLALYFYLKGVDSNSKGDWINAQSYFNTAIQNDPHYADAFAGRAWANINIGNYENAVKDCDTTLGMKESLSEKKVSDVYFYRGSAYFFLNLNDQALSDLNEAIKLDPSKGVYYTIRGGIKKKAFSDKKGACEDWNMALKCGGEDTGAARYIEENCK